MEDGPKLSVTVGNAEGMILGAKVGPGLGNVVGPQLFVTVGELEGATLGVDEGPMLFVIVGDPEGKLDGT